MTPRLSKFMLTSHITFSVGWLGAVVVFLALAITGLTSQNLQNSPCIVNCDGAECMAGNCSILSYLIIYRCYPGGLYKVGVI